MESAARDLLVDAVARFGREIAADSRRCEALLSDAFGERHGKERSVLLAAVRAGVADELSKPQSQGVTEALLSRLSQRLQDQHGLEPAAARWSVESWALAFGAARRADLTFEIACPHCGTSFKVMTWLAGKAVTCPKCKSGVVISADRQRLTLVGDDGVTPLVPPPPPPVPRPPPPRPPPPPRAPTPVPVPAPPPAQAAAKSGSPWGWIGAAAAAGVALLAFQSGKSPAPASPVVSVPAPAPSSVTEPTRPAPPPVERASLFDPTPVFAANLASLMQVLQAASEGQPTDVEAVARAAAREFDFQPRLAALTRDRQTARPLNAQALALAGTEITPERAREALAIQRQAFAADPFDIEIAGNLAIYLLRSGDVTQAARFTVYAMSLPRPLANTGRTADWSTLAAVFAAAGDPERARHALFVTLALTSNVAKRCEVAVNATRNTYGPVLRAATEAMLERVRERDLSDAPECALPINW